MSDWNLYSGTPMFPGQCFCGSQEQPFVDTGVELSFGDDARPYRVYLCPKCVRVAALLHGWVGPEAADEMLEEIERKHATITDLEARLAVAEDPASRVVQFTAQDLVGAIADELKKPKAAA